MPRRPANRARGQPLPDRRQRVRDVQRGPQLATWAGEREAMDCNRPMRLAWNLSVIVGVAGGIHRAMRIATRTGLNARGLASELGRECLASQVKSLGHCEHGRCMQGRWWAEVHEILEIAREMFERTAANMGIGEDSEGSCQTRH